MTIMGPRNRSSFALAVCRRLFPAVATTVILLSAGLAAAAELEGFGPIKFGMTKEQAWEAIEGRGVWVSDDRLEYALIFENDYSSYRLEARQEFEKEHAADVFVRHESEDPGDYCIQRGLRFAGTIMAKYGIEPLKIDGKIKQVSTPDQKFRHIIEDLYVFRFDRNASIQIRVSAIVQKADCRIAITYRAPSAEHGPF